MKSLYVGFVEKRVGLIKEFMKTQKLSEEAAGSIAESRQGL